MRQERFWSEAVMTELGSHAASGGASLPFADIGPRILASTVVRAGVETVPLAAAIGRISAVDVIAPRSLPPADNSAVDGYAVHWQDLAADAPTYMALHGRSPAGAPPTALPRGQAERIFTGALLPEGADTVLMQEDCTPTPDGVILPSGIARGANCRRAGEDILRGALAVAAGRRLGPPEIGLLAALGFPAVEVRTRLRVVVFSTGDELVNPPAELRPGQVYDANRPLLLALLGRLGAQGVDGGLLPDTAERTREALAAAAREADLVITSGGVSTGEEDHVRAAITSLGAIRFWRVAMKPGRPVAVGQIGDVPLLGLPGNPVAALVTFIAVGRPLFDRLAGAVHEPPPRFPLRVGFSWRKKAGRREFLPARRDAEGVARLHRAQGSAILTALTEGDVLLELPEALTSLAVGDSVAAIPLCAVYG
jgi:molybdopterin molybdotransferase